MPRNPKDTAETRRAIEDWIQDRPNASIVVAAIDEQPDGALDIALRINSLSGSHLIGLIQALVDHTLSVIERSPIASASREYETLCDIKALLDRGPRLMH